MTDKVLIKNNIKEIWAEILPIQEFDDHADFFELGGNSLKLIAMQDMFQKHPQFSVIKGLNILDFFDRPDLSDLTDYVYQKLSEIK